MSDKMDPSSVPSPDAYIKIGEHIIASGMTAGLIMLVALATIFCAGVVVGRFY